MVTRIFTLTSNGNDIAKCDEEIAQNLDHVVNEHSHILGKQIAVNTLDYTRHSGLTTYLKVMVSFEGATA